MRYVFTSKYFSRSDFGRRCWWVAGGMVSVDCRGVSEVLGVRGERRSVVMLQMCLIKQAGGQDRVREGGSSLTQLRAGCQQGWTPGLRAPCKQIAPTPNLLILFSSFIAYIYSESVLVAWKKPSKQLPFQHQPLLFIYMIMIKQGSMLVCGCILYQANCTYQEFPWTWAVKIQLYPNTLPHTQPCLLTSPLSSGVWGLGRGGGRQKQG